MRKTAMKKTAMKTISVWEKTGGICWYCGCKCDISGDGGSKQFGIDHVVPMSCGGSNSLENLVPCCRGCNSTKGNDTVEKLRERMALKMANKPRFSRKQLEYLKSIGVELPETDDFIFYFEAEGL